MNIKLPFHQTHWNRLERGSTIVVKLSTGANVQLLEMRFLDSQLDLVLERAYEQLARGRGPGLKGPDLRRLARYQLDAAVLFEQVSNALKLIGDQFLARVYAMAGRRFHLGEWDAAVTRKLEREELVWNFLFIPNRMVRVCEIGR